jgi:hypothetical protein
MPVPASLVTVKFTTGGLLMVTLVTPTLSVVEAASAAVAPVADVGPPPVAAALLDEPPPPPQAARVRVSTPAANPRRDFPQTGKRLIHAIDDLYLFIAALFTRNPPRPNNIAPIPTVTACRFLLEPGS